MSFGFSFSDIAATVQLAFKVYQSYRTAEDDFQKASNDVQVIWTSLRELEDEAKNPSSLLYKLHRSEDKIAQINGLVSSCSSTLRELEAILVKHVSLGSTNPKALDRLRFGLRNVQATRLAANIRSLTLFLTAMNRAVLGRIDRKLDRIVQEIRLRDKGGSPDSRLSILSIASDDEQSIQGLEFWNAMKTELVDDETEESDIEAHKDWVQAQFRKRVSQVEERGNSDSGSETDFDLSPQTSEFVKTPTGSKPLPKLPLETYSQDKIRQPMVQSEFQALENNDGAFVIPPYPKLTTSNRDQSSRDGETLNTPVKAPDSGYLSIDGDEHCKGGVFAPVPGNRKSPGRRHPLSAVHKRQRPHLVRDSLADISHNLQVIVRMYLNWYPDVLDNNKDPGFYQDNLIEDIELSVLQKLHQLNVDSVEPGVPFEDAIMSKAALEVEAVRWIRAIRNLSVPESTVVHYYHESLHYLRAL